MTETEASTAQAEARAAEPGPRARGEARRATGPGRRAPAHLIALGAIVALGAALRLVSLDVQSYDYDELQSVVLIRLDFVAMLREIPQTESTPPLYYVVAWIWSRAFGDGEVALRALSAIFGIATVPVAYAAAREVASRRVAVTAAALVALSPWLIWYSQEARAYALMVLLTAVGLVFFVRSLDAPTGRRLAAWAAASSLAVAAHYYALFPVAVEAVWLLVAHRGRRTVLALIPLGATAAALAPLLLYQRGQGHGDAMIAQSGSLPLRVAKAMKQSLIGYDAPAEAVLTVLGIALAAVAVVLAALRASRPQQKRLLLPVAVAAGALAVPVLLALAGSDYVVSRNLIAGWVPAAIVVAAGIAARRVQPLGAAVGAALCVVFAVAAIAVVTDGKYQRDDWRGAARSLGPAAVDRAIVLTPTSPPHPFEIYLPGLRRPRGERIAVREIDVVGIANAYGRAGRDRAVPRPETLPPPAPGFVLAGRDYGATYTVLRFRARQPVSVSTAALARRPLQGERASVLVQPRREQGGR